MGFVPALLWITSAAAASGSPAAELMTPPSTQALDVKVEETMLRMRLLGVLLEDVRRQSGAYPLADALIHPVGEGLRKPGVEVKDAWGGPILYRANSRAYELISLGSNKRAEIDHDQRQLGWCGVNRVEDAADPTDDLVLRCGTFTRRPFGPYSREFTTVNSILAVSVAAASYTIDFSTFPAPNQAFSPVADLETELEPVYIKDLPTMDGWGRPLRYLSTASSFIVVSYGADGLPDRQRYEDFDCRFTLGPWETVFQQIGGDTVFACGKPVLWPRGVEP